jgi:hypothetical protein
VIHAIRPEYRRPYERLLSAIRLAAASSRDGRRARQVQGWRVFKYESKPSNGAVTYLHLFAPVLADSDYNLLTLARSLTPERLTVMTQRLHEGTIANIQVMFLRRVQTLSWRLEGQAPLPR